MHVRADPCRFCRLFALSVPALSLVMGAWTSLQLVLAQSSAPGGEVLGASLVRATAPAASGSALLLALVLWAHPLRPAALEVELPRICRRAALVALPGYLLASAVAVLVGLGVLGAPRVAGILPADFAAGALAAALDSALAVALAWRFLGRLQATKLSLAGKLIVVLTVTVPLRVTLALALSAALSD